mgnify:CR=1 FL=1
MINVLDNAIKYSKPGKKVEIRMRKLTSYVLIEVFDEGIGIPKKDRNKIFRGFIVVRKQEKWNVMVRV